MTARIVIVADASSDDVDDVDDDVVHD